jgi:hypothetical protein
MSGPELFAVIALMVCLLVLAIGALAVGLRAAAVAKRARKLETHPTLVAARRMPEIIARLNAAKEGFAAASERGRGISENVAKILSSLAVLGLNVDRVAFATKLFLTTFVPTLAGSMGDD